MNSYRDDDVKGVADENVGRASSYESSGIPPIFHRCATVCNRSVISWISIQTRRPFPYITTRLAFRLFSAVRTWERGDTEITKGVKA